MKKMIAATFAFLIPALAFADVGVELSLALDLSRKNTAISWSWTECCDTAVEATVIRNGDDFPVEGWETYLVVGGPSSGCVIEGVKTGYNNITFTVPATSMPTNGKYTVQVNAMRNRRSEEWGRGNVRVNMNPGMDYMPTCWMGYQKVAKLAASMLTLELMTNDLVQAVSSNFVMKSAVEIQPYTNVCFKIGKSFVEGLGRGYEFFWDRTSGNPKVFRTSVFPNGVFKTYDGGITNAWFELTRGGSTFTYTNDTTGTFFPASPGGVKKFNAILWWNNDTAWGRAIND